MTDLLRSGYLHFLILTMPDKEIISVSLREGEDFLDDLYEDFGDYYILETGDDTVGFDL